MTDEQFNAAMERMRQKDREALREIYECYIGYVYRIIYDIVRNPQTAEDITSDFFIRLWERSAQYRSGNGHRGYLATIARNMTIDYLRKTGHEELLAGTDDDDSGPDALSLQTDNSPSPEDSAVSDLSVEQALDKLKPVYRQIVTMKVLGEMTFQEIADTMEMPLGTVTWNYREAIKQLRRFGYE
ncbi:MAG: RNA polymerase sigma factor [Lachnospiraceae bacterium]|nr:RNA polymerase sigma factor [Lachnospiraceae bacterium]